jgi:predicted esterase
MAVRPRSWLAGAFAFCVAVSLAGCGDDAEGDLPDASDTNAHTDETDAAAVDDGGTGPGGSGVPLADVTCDTKPPPGAPEPPALPDYTGGECPEIAIGRNMIESSGAMREFVLVGPKTIDPEKPLPVAFMWAWLTGNADQFIAIGMLEALADKYHFLAVVPDPKGDLLFTWPGDILAATARLQEEFTFFDDMLTCVSGAFPVNRSCVASIGVSAGALFTSQLAGGRGDYLASAIALSGGVGGVSKPWITPDHKLPMFVLWGGTTDQCGGILNFEVTSRNLESALTEGGHFVVECTHNCGHSVPPFDSGSPVEPVVDFVLKHPYWLAPGESPYNETGLPDTYPSWCAIGVGNAEPRTGDCPAGLGCPTTLSGILPGM